MSAAIYWYPDPSGTLEVLTLAALSAVTECQDDGYSAQVGESATGDGTLYQVLLAMPYRLQVKLEKVVGEANRRAMENVIHHLRRGGSIGLALDADKAWGSFVPIPPGGSARGGTSTTVQGQAWYSTTAALASGDPICIETGWPDWLSEQTTTSATVANGASSVSHAALLQSFAAAPIHVRHRDFWPILRFGSSAAAARALTSSRRISYDVTLDLVYDVAGVLALDGRGPVVRQASASKFSGASVEDALNNARGTRRFGGFNG